jgi:hypothetical protein
VDSRAGLDDVKKRNSLTLSGLTGSIKNCLERGTGIVQLVIK